jgi:hypothetical protein
VQLINRKGVRMLSSLLIGTGVTILYIMYKLSKADKNNPIIRDEVRRIVTDSARVDTDYTSSGRVYTRGLTVIIDETTKKYKTIPQAKVCDIGFC